MDIKLIQERIDSIVGELNQLRELVSKSDQATPRFPESAVTLVNQKICLNCLKSTRGKRIVRGNHDYCYKTVMASIDAGQITEADAISNGLLTPIQRGGRKPSGDTRLAKMIQSDEANEELLNAAARAAEAKSTYQTEQANKTKSTKKKTG